MSHDKESRAERININVENGFLEFLELLSKSNPNLTKSKICYDLMMYGLMWFDDRFGLGEDLRIVSKSIAQLYGFQYNVHMKINEFVNLNKLKGGTK